uniref:Uncharacterized protein n=1 Tax=Trichuris muris TaxID=70415 RepID=A0A5S6QZI0_TRIMR
MGSIVSNSKFGETIVAQIYWQEVEERNQSLEDIGPSMTSRRQSDELDIEGLPRPPYSPGLSPTDIDLFKNVEMGFDQLLTSRTAAFYAEGIKGPATPR